jgi:hypothetical protein
MNLTCEEVASLVSQSIDRELSRGERLAVQLHLLYCSACRRYRRQILLIREALLRFIPADGQEDPHGPSIPPDVRERIKRALREG